MSGTITLPREVVELIESLMHHAYNDGVKQLKHRSSQTVEAEEALRTALAAEQPKPEPVAKACWACNGKGCLRDIDTAGLLPCVVCKPQEDKT